MRKGFLGPVFAAAVLCGCGDELSSGTEIPNELTGLEVVPGSGPAARVAVRIVPVGYRPGGNGGENGQLPSYRTVTDASGRFRISGILPGQYNVLAEKDGFKSYRDSVAITEIDLDLGADTLAIPGSLHGTVVLQPNHDPRSAAVQALGTSLFVNVDSAGRFVLPDLAPGRYRLQVETSLEGYARLYASAEARSGKADTIPALKPFYARIPVVTGLWAFTDSDGNISLGWDRTDYPNADGYLIYRDSAAAILPSAVPIARTGKTFYTDTVFAPKPRAGQYPSTDTAIREFTYRVRILDRGGDIGPAFAKATGVAYSSGQVVVSGAWSLASQSAPFPARSQAAAAEFGGRLWVLGGMDKPGRYYHDVWSSRDGLAWVRETDSLPIAYRGAFRTAAFGSRLWLLALETRNDGQYPVCYASSDGRAWARMGGPDAPISRPPPLEPWVSRTGLAFAAFRDKLWLIGANPGIGVYSSPDGVSWTRAAIPESFAWGSEPEAIAYGGRLWVMGGGDSDDTLFHAGIWATPDGADWAAVSDSAPFLPRIGFGLAADLQDLYVIGGGRPAAKAGGGFEFRDFTDQVWRGTGEKWSLFDSHAPIGRRRDPGIVSFQGKIWCIGGATGPDRMPLGDLWVLDP